MSNVQVKHLDQATHDALRERATVQGLSISEYVLELIRRDLRKPTRQQWFERARALTPIAITTDAVLAIREDGHDRQTAR